MEPIIWYIIAAIIALTLIVTPALQKANAGDKPFEGRVAFVKDGDSIVIEGVRRDIRIWGIDAPEKGEVGADVARALLNELVDGKLVRIDPVDQDKYGRIVARVYRGRDSDIGAMLIERGAVREYCRFSKNYYGTCR